MSNTFLSLLPIQPKPVPAVSAAAMEGKVDVALDITDGFDEPWDSINYAGVAPAHKR